MIANCAISILPPRNICQKLVELANQKDGNDNITDIVAWHG